MKIKRIMATVIAATTMAVGISNISANAAYYSKGEWDVFKQYGAPGDVNHGATVKLNVYTGGYKTYCSSITGSNDRYVQVNGPGNISFKITTTGYSAKYATSAHDSNNANYYTFSFTPEAYRGNCDANGTVGYEL